jgi:hypothetical protein
MSNVTIERWVKCENGSDVSITPVAAEGKIAATMYGFNISEPRRLRWSETSFGIDVS